MNWYNEPEKWKASDDKLEMFVTPKTDFWRETFYGFTADDAPFYYTTRGGDFVVTLKITGEYKESLDQMGLMLRIDEKHWIKTGIEYFGSGSMRFFTVVTNKKSSKSHIELSKQPKSVWIVVTRKKDAVVISYSLTGINDSIGTNICYLKNNAPVMVGMMGASPIGKGFNAIFEEFSIQHSPSIPDDYENK